MKYISIDIETTGLDPETCQILQIGAVIEDTKNPKPIDELPRFQCIIEHDAYSGQPTAIAMNHWLFEILAGLEKQKDGDSRLEYRKAHKITPVGMVAKAFSLWLMSNGINSESGPIQINAAGKNFASFDKKFIEKLPGWNNLIRIRQRILDPAALVIDWEADETLPSLNVCMKRLGVSGEVTHDAVQDALDVIRVIRQATNDYTISKK